MPGFAEFVMLLLVAMFVFATGKLPQIANSVGKAVARFRGSVDEDSEQDHGEESKPSST